MVSNNTNTISCNNVSKAYGQKRVLDNISLEVSNGEYFGLVGMNGSGKTTIIKSILDLTSIDSGTINIHGKSHRRVSARDNISYLPDCFSPPAHLKCKDFIAYMLELNATKCSSETINKMLDALELDQDTMQMSVSKLSKGMTQKLGLASCLLSGKKLFILDEPMSGLDPKARILFKQKLLKLKGTGVSVFFSSHVLADVEELADKMAVLHKNKILFTGTTQEFKKTYGGNRLEDTYMNCVNQAQVM